MFFLLGSLLMMAVFLCLAVIYFVPTLIAYNRKHHNLNAIFVLNLFLGFSFIGWVIALSWALTRVQPVNGHHSVIAG